MAWKTHKTDKADSLFSLYIRHRDGWKCRKCGRYYEPPTNLLHAAHFVGRGKENTRFNPDNAVSLCFHDHQYFHSHPSEFQDWFTNEVGEDKVQEVRQASRLYKKRDRELERLYWRQRLWTDFKVKA